MRIASKLVIALLLLSLSATCAAVSHRGPVLRSLLVPGWGELSVGNKTGYIFIATEIMLWSSHFYFLNESDLMEDRAHDYAVQWAGIEPGSYPETYWTDLAKYNSSGYDAGGYNEEILREAMSRYPDDPTAQQDYIDANAYSDLYAWDWSDQDHRAHFSKLRRDITHNSDYAKTVTGVIVVNHLLSGLNALRSSVSRQRADVHVGLRRDGTPMLAGTVRF